MNTPSETTKLLDSKTQVSSQGITVVEAIYVDNNEKLSHRYSFRNILLLVLASVIPIGCVYIWSIASYSPSLYTALSSAQLPQGSKIRFSSVVHDKFVRAENGNILLTENIPWEHGSTFEVYRYDEECFQLKSMKNLWMALDYGTGMLKADGLLKINGDYFSAVYPNGDDKKEHVYLKVCRKDLWLETSPKVSFESNDPMNKIDASSQNTNTALIVRLTTESMKITIKNPFLSFLGQSSSPSSSITQPATALFRIHPIAFPRGVNLGGWFIPEVWMNPSFFSGTNLGWGGSVCKFHELNRTWAEERMQDHLATWITEADIREIAMRGFNSVRVPVGYWNLIADPYHKFVPVNHHDSLRYIDWLFDITAQLNLTVLLDLHGAPGSQNGMDHSGCNEMPNWLTKHNVDLTLQTVEAMAQRYGHRSNLLGFELVNEPSSLYSIGNHSALVTFFESAYRIIRTHNKECMVVINELYEASYRRWGNALQEPDFYNVIMDFHLYNWQGHYTAEAADRHVQDAKEFGGLIEMYTPLYPIMVGEWCMSTGTVVQVGQRFVTACVRSFEKSFGWYMWNWKIERGVHFDEWDVQYELSQKNGLTPFIEKL